MTFKEFIEAARAAGVEDSDEIEWMDWAYSSPEFDRFKCGRDSCDDWHLKVG